MAVIPLTLVISLCLVFTFVLFFLVEHSRRRYGSAESQAILPLAEETPRLVQGSVAVATVHARRAGAGCGCSRGERPACADCRNARHS